MRHLRLGKCALVIVAITLFALLTAGGCGGGGGPDDGFHLTCTCQNFFGITWDVRTCMRDKQSTETPQAFFDAEGTKCRGVCGDLFKNFLSLFGSAVRNFQPLTCTSHNDPAPCQPCRTPGDPSVPADSSDGTWDHAKSLATLSLNGSSATVHATGTFAYRGGACSGECPITLTEVDVQADDFSVAGLNASAGEFFNFDFISGTKLADGRLVFPKQSSTLDGNVTIEGQGRIAGTFVPTEDVTGVLDPNARSLKLHGHLVSPSGEATLDLVGSIDHTPPLAVAGPDQNVACDPHTGTASVTLDGRASSNPGGAPFQLVWGDQAGNQLADTALATVSLAPGAHTLYLIAFTDTKAGVGSLTVDVVNSEPPSVTAPPDISIASCDGAAIDPGMPTVVNACDSLDDLARIRITRTIESINGRQVNRIFAPGTVFEPGTTVIRYDVIDANGAMVSVKQRIVVGPDASRWVAKHAYAKGDRVTFQGQIYQCIQAHTSLSTWQPTATPALWAIPTPCGVVPWAAQTLYVVGSKVTFNGHQYACTTAHESLAGWNPVAAASLWRRVD